MSKRERKARVKRLVALFLALTLALGFVTPTRAVAKAGSNNKGLKSSLYELSDLRYNPCDGPTPSGETTPPPSDPDPTAPPSNPDPAPVYVSDPTYVLISVEPVADKITVGKGVSEYEMMNRFPKMTGLNLTADGSPTSATGSITWTEKSRETVDAHTKKITYTGSVSIPYYVTNPNNVSTELSLTAFMTDKTDISKAQILLKPKKGETERPMSFVYTGKQIRPEVEVVFEKNTLPENVYTVTYGENINVSYKNTVTITANEDSDYAGSVTREFEITKAKQLMALNHSTKSFVYNPNMSNGSEVTCNLYINDDPKKVYFSRIDYKSDKLLDDNDKPTNPSLETKKITLDQEGVLHIADGIACGDYVLNITTSGRGNFDNPQTEFTVRVGVDRQADWILVPDSALANNEKEVSYDTMGGQIYIVKPDGTEEELTSEILRDYYITDTVDDNPYKLRVGSDPKKYEYVIRKGNQDSSKGKVLKFGGWCTEKDGSSPYYGDTITSGKHVALYANWKSEQDITGEKSYTKYFGNSSFSLDAKAKTKLTYKSSNKSVATVNDKGVVAIKGLGTAIITVKAAESSKYMAATKNITIKVTPRPTSISGIAKGEKSGTVMLGWKKVAKVKGYQIRYSTNSNATNSHTKRIPDSDSKSTTVQVAKGKKYYYWIRTYIGSYYSAWSSCKSYKLQ